MANNWIDYKSLKQQISMEMVLAHYGVRLRKVGRSYLRGKCPSPQHAASKSDDSFGVDTTKNAWACQSQSCVAARDGKKGGNVLDFIALMGNISIRVAALKLATWFPVEPGSPPGRAAPATKTPQLVAEKTNEGEESAPHVTFENKPLSFQLKGIDIGHEYIAERGLTRETAEYFGIGYFPGKGSMAGRVVIPIHNRVGELVAYAGRSIDDTDPRYKLPGGFHKTLELWNLHRVLALGRELVIVVEGFFGAAHMHQAGERRVVALMGLSMSEEQERALAEFSRVVLMLDGGAAGRDATALIAPRLMRHTFVKTIELPDGTQPDTIPLEQLTSFLGLL